MGLAESLNLIEFCKNFASKHVITMDRGRKTSARVGDLQKREMFPARQQVQSHREQVCAWLPAAHVDTPLGICHS